MRRLLWPQDRKKSAKGAVTQVTVILLLGETGQEVVMGCLQPNQQPGKRLALHKSGAPLTVREECSSGRLLQVVVK